MQIEDLLAVSSRQKYRKSLEIFSQKYGNVLLKIKDHHKRMVERLSLLMAVSGSKKKNLRH